MFPRLDPAVPLARQQYYPTVDVSRGVAAATSRVDIRSYSPSLYSQQEPSFRREEIYKQRTGLTNGLGLKNVLNPSEGPKEVACISTPIELVDVWAFANGQETSGAAREYKLELSW